MSSSDPRVARDPLGLGGRTLLDRYLVESAIAKGGMAIIYRGRDQRLLRPVCIKVFHRLRPDEVGYKTAYDHFVQEAFALSQFSHPNTLRIYDFGYLEGEPGAPFQISELLEGGTLGQLVRQDGPLAPEDALEILEPVAGALAEAHARGIVHRDIKPSNILFGVAGSRRVVKLCDFGIAKATEDTQPNRAEDTMASAGQRLRLYSPGWAAPEQLRGDPVGPGADVFSLGLVIGYALTGKPIFPTTLDAAAIEARSDNDAHVVRALRSFALPAPLVEVIQRACRERIEERFPSIESMGAALRAAARAIPRGPDRLETEPFRPVSARLVEPDAAAISIEIEPVALSEPLGRRPAGSPPPGPPLMLDPIGDEEVVVAGRRLRLVPLAGGDTLDLGGDGPYLRSPARFRVTLTPSGGPVPRVNVKGLNCFVARAGARPTTAIDVEGDADVSLLAPDRRPLDAMRCGLGRTVDGNRLYDLGNATLAVPAAVGAVLLDLGPGRELALLHRGVRAAGKSERSLRNKR